MLFVLSMIVNSINKLSLPCVCQYLYCKWDFGTWHILLDWQPICPMQQFKHIWNSMSYFLRGFLDLKYTVLSVTLSKSWGLNCVPSMLPPVGALTTATQSTMVLLTRAMEPWEGVVSPQHGHQWAVTACTQFVLSGHTSDSCSHAITATLTWQKCMEVEYNKRRYHSVVCFEE